MEYTSRLFDTSRVVEIPRELPKAYGQDTLVLMTRDPWWAYAYWEVTEATRQAVQKRMGEEYPGSQVVLRVYEVSGDREVSQAPIHLDVPVQTFLGSWYLQLGVPNRSFVAELGFLASSGKFFPLVRSNRISLPRADLAEIYDTEWMVVEEEFRKIYRVSGGGRQGPSSEELVPLAEDLRKLLLRRMAEEQASGVLAGSWFGSGVIH